MVKLLKIKFLFIFFTYLFIPLIPISAFEVRDYLLFEMLVNSCYRDNKNCNSALVQINNFQKKAAINKKFSCQTRLLGLEANLVMAMNYNLKRNEAKRIIKSMKKYC